MVVRVDIVCSSQRGRCFKSELIHKADVLTPNIPEAEVLAGIEITSVDDMRRAGECLLRMGADRS